MKLFVLRHGQAEGQASSDFERRLTAKGLADVTSVTRRFNRDLQTLDEIWASPLVRAQQSARAVLSKLPEAPAFSTTEALVPEADLNRLYQKLNDSEAGSLLLVSHQPLVGDLVNDLCGTEPGYHLLGTASIACIDVEVFASSMGELIWLHHPPH